MEVEISKLFVLERIVNKYKAEKNGKVALLFARNGTIISGPIKDVRDVTTDTPAMEEFSQARKVLAKEFADRDADGAPKQELDSRTGQLIYSISRLGAFSQAVERMLVEKYPQAKIDQEEIEKRTNEIFREKIDIDFYRMELTKIPGYRHENDEENGVIESGDLGILMELGILYEKEEEKGNVTELDVAKKKSMQKNGESKANASDV